VRVVTEGFGRAVGSVFTNSSGRKIICRFNFEMEVDLEGAEGEGAVGVEGAGGPHVVVDPEEHQDYVWATEEEVRRGNVGGKKITITNRQMQALIFEGFRLRREEVGARGFV
jgi:hypothetical protein